MEAWQLAECLKRQSKLSQSLMWFDRALKELEGVNTSYMSADYKAIARSYQDALRQMGRKKEISTVAKRVQRQVRAWEPVVIHYSRPRGTLYLQQGQSPPEGYVGPVEYAPPLPKEEEYNPL